MRNTGRRCTLVAPGRALPGVALLLALCAPVEAVMVDGPVACPADAPVVPVTAGAPLALRDAVAAALLGSPDLAVAACEIRVREARTIQARLFANPELRVDVENVAGSGARRDDEQAETTVLLAQLFELGGKRRARVRAAGLARDLAAWDYETRRLEVLATTIKAFVATLAAQERVAVAVERMEVADATARGVAAQVDAGAAPPVDLARARVAAGRAEVAHRRALRDLAMARGVLAATWGSGRARFARVEGSLRALDAVLAVGADAPSIAGNPDVARWQTEQARRASALALAEAGRIPDVTVGAGGRYFSDNGDGALVLELTVPLPLVDRGRAAVGVARHRLARAEAERRAVERATEVALAGAYDRLAAAREEAMLLRERLVPEARRAVAAASDAFRNGRIHFTDLLDAELVAFEMREDEIRALEVVQAAAVDISRLTGTPPGWVEKGGDE